MLQSKIFSKDEKAALIQATDQEATRDLLQGPYSESEITVLMETERWALNSQPKVRPPSRGEQQGQNN